MFLKTMVLNLGAVNSNVAQSLSAPSGSLTFAFIIKVSLVVQV